MGPPLRNSCLGGVLIVDKPEGPTSHDVVARLRRILGTRQVGHAGTLDPMATGVLVVAIDEATKLVPWLTSDDKAYEAALRLGVATDTLDADGQVTERVDPSPALADALRRMTAERLPELIGHALAAERARAEQVPPAFSAIRVGGERAHAIARRGDAIELPARSVLVKRLEAVSGGLTPEPHIRLVLEVTKGYFVRSLARDLAAALGTVGHLTSLRRTRSGAFGLEDAIPFIDVPPRDEAERDERRARFRAAVVPLERAAARALPVSVVTDEGVRAAAHGQRLRPEQIADPHLRPSAWLDTTGRLIAIGEGERDGGARVLRGFRE